MSGALRVKSFIVVRPRTNTSGALALQVQAGICFSSGWPNGLPGAMFHSVSSPVRFTLFIVSAVLQGWAVVILTRHFFSQLKSRVPRMHWRGIGLLAAGQLTYWLAKFLESA